MTTTASDVPTSTLVGRYATGLTGRHLREHGVASPLGLWLLLAAAGPATAGPARQELEAALGADVSDAARRAGALLASPHPAVAQALAMWQASGVFAGPGWDSWCASLPSQVERGPVPTQEQANQWAADRTGQLITTFPADIRPDTILVLASALASRIRWTVPFDDAAPDDLGGPFAGAARVLRTPAEGHEVFLAQTDAAGLVAVHAASSGDGLQVISVIAAPDVPAGEVHVAAMQVGALLSGAREAQARRVSLFDVPLGEGHAWTLSEEQYTRLGGGTLEQTADAVLPAWAAASKHDLSKEPGVQALGDAFADMGDVSVRPVQVEVDQAVVATFAKEGFDGAAVTAMTFLAGNVPSRVQVRHRHAHVQFNRPYAVLALTRDSVPDPGQPWRSKAIADVAWAGVPVFHAWVATPA